MGIPISEIAQSIKGGEPAFQGTWIHPQIAVHLAQWLSPEFAVKVSHWAIDLDKTPLKDQFVDAALHRDPRLSPYQGPPWHFG